MSVQARIERRGHRPWVERVWGAERPGIATWFLRALAVPYAGVTSAARAIAARTRRRVDGVTVVAVGGLTVGGAGKTTLTRWAAREALGRGLKPAVLLRGYGSGAGKHPTMVPPDAAGWNKAGDMTSRYGDEAVAHRAALPPGALVIVGSDRFEAACLARDHGANTVLLDDGWEQGTLVWDALWVAMDPVAPYGNGHTLPGGPLRRPPSNLLQANAIALIAEEKGEALDRAWASIQSAHRGGPPLVRFLRQVEGWKDLHGADRPAPEGEALVVSSVGSPSRLERFLQGAGVRVRRHIAFPDHAAWDRDTVALGVSEAGRPDGPAPTSLVVTDKDAVRARGLGDVGLPIIVASSGLRALDDASPLLAALRAPATRVGTPVAAERPIR